MFWVLFGIILGCFLGGFLRLIKRLRYWKERGVPYIEANSNFTKNPVTSFVADYVELKKRAGKFPFIGIYDYTVPMAMITDLDFAKKVLVKDFAYFKDRVDYTNVKEDPLSGLLIFKIGEEWRICRRKFGTIFTLKNLKMFHTSMVDAAMEFHKHMVGQMDGDVNASDLVHRQTVEICGRISFGTIFASIRNQEEFRSLLDEIKKVTYNILIFFFVATWFPTLCRLFKIKVANATHAKLFTKHMEKSLQQVAENVSQEVTMAGLFVKNQKSGDLTFNDTIGFFYSFYSGQFDVINKTLIHAMYELGLNQEIQNRARKEIAETLNKFDGEWSFDACMEMNYIDQIIYETLRKYPILFILTRICRQDYAVEGTSFTIEKGTRIVIPVYKIHHDPDIYPDPEKFIPERFTKDAIEGRHSCAWLPFGDGLKVCIGKRFAIMQIRNQLMSFISTYRFCISPKMKEPLQFDDFGSDLPTNTMWLTFERI
ncbi:probable cytochrome P450 6a17 [Lutzomyia longipalpis]|uniref:probable cytochrome P450 6a17 n=1 Tax=Lutzomyia longipalpis TaxID=7200 RepID=UPI002483DD4D|nr:probable cytochrome P450 6a17 [Lutzomyia longipalpis]